VQTLQIQLSNLEKLNKDSREYQVALAGIKTTASKLLSETSTKVLPESNEVNQEITDCIEDCFNPEINLGEYFTEFNSALDSLKYKDLIRKAVQDKLRQVCFSKGLNVSYVKMLSRVSTLRKLRASLEVLQGILEMKENIEYLKQDVKVQMVYPSELLKENTLLKEERDRIYGIYTQDDEEIGLYFKYRKYKEEGLSNRAIAELLNTNECALRRLARGFTSEIQSDNRVRLTVD